MKLEATATELMLTVHAHPTLHEAVMEAAADALGHCVHQ
jgi:dihydrolipoamide dehydrogenase